MEEMASILREKFKANPIIRCKEKEFWSNNESLLIVDKNSGRLLKMYPQQLLTDDMINLELN